MYKVIYQKENGDIIERVRNSLPEVGIGQTTSMGWLIKDILHNYKDNYYTYSDYCLLMNKAKKVLKIRRKLTQLYQKYKEVIIIILTFIAAKTIF